MHVWWNVGGWLCSPRSSSLLPLYPAPLLTPVPSSSSSLSCASSLTLFLSLLAHSLSFSPRSLSFFLSSLLAPALSPSPLVPFRFLPSPIAPPPSLPLPSPPSPSFFCYPYDTLRAQSFSFSRPIVPHRSPSLNPSFPLAHSCSLRMPTLPLIPLISSSFLHPSPPPHSSMVDLSYNPDIGMHLVAFVVCVQVTHTGDICIHRSNRTHSTSPTAPSSLSTFQYLIDL